jgi:hypothetical protein
MSGLNLLVFRADQRRLSGPELKLQLLTALEPLRVHPSGDLALAALLRAGELECGIADAVASQDAEALPFAKLTDCVAQVLLSGAMPPEFQTTKEDVCRAPVPELLTLSTPEGFAYYALHPFSYARVLDIVGPLPQDVVVIGIRTIGTTLSAVAAAAARLRGLNVRRITVRPNGHPYDRQTEFSSQQVATIHDAISHNAAFLIVDEGPGLSGSSFLSVAEALERAGAPREKIILLCGHQPNVEALCCTNAAQRWRRFRSVSAAGEPARPQAAEMFVGGGEWRNLLYTNSSQWPASWTTMERLKYVSSGDPQRLFKFTGLGHYGTQVIERERAVAAAGFGPAPRRESGGFVSYPWINGRAGSSRDLSRGVLDRLAEYCAFRANALAVRQADIALLQEMAEHNLAELGSNLTIALKLERPVVADGRMQPHEWLFTDGGEMLKTDSGSHGDDHFFPGPTDIAWDLAGVIVEWRMTPGQASEFLDRYRSLSGDSAGRRIEDFIAAYAVFRWAHCKMAANAMQGKPEQARLDAAAENYAAMLPALRAASGF